MRAARFSCVLLSLSLVTLACGSTASEFANGNGNGDGDDGMGGASGGLGGGGGSSGESSSGGGGGSGDACAAKSANADRSPAHLFFILDQSLSMQSPDPQRWTRVTTAFKAFLNDPLSDGVSASLEMFPVKSGNACDASKYATLDVPLQALPGSAPFESFLNQTPNTPSTPTLYVLRSIAPMAKAHAIANPGVKTAIVLMTDGTPQGCTGQSINDAATEVANVKDTVPTYVIGVGSNLTNLNAIAASGGTTQAFLIDDTTNPAAAEKQFRDAIDAIRGLTLACDLAIPPPPAGETLDLNKINVSFTSGAGVEQALVFDEACGSAGWKFDSPSAPTKIVLCPAACDAFKADPKGVVGVEFGCERRNAGVN